MAGAISGEAMWFRHVPFEKVNVGFWRWWRLVGVKHICSELHNTLTSKEYAGHRSSYTTRSPGMAHTFLAEN